MAPQAGVETQRGLLAVEPRQFPVVLGLEATHHPTLPLHDCQADNDHHLALVLSAGLLQAGPPLRLVVLVAD
jgi:hypothetical protein